MRTNTSHFFFRGKALAFICRAALLQQRALAVLYNFGGTSISLGEIANIVRSYLPDAKITFQHERGAKEANATYLLDNSRLCSEFGVRYPPFPERVLQIINETRRGVGLPPVGQPH
jgi:hypothetical protein